MNNFGFNLAISLYLVGFFAFLFNGGKNFIMLVISLEIILLATTLLFVTISYQIDDLVGANIALLILPLAGAESAIALAFLIAFYPLRGNISLS